MPTRQQNITRLQVENKIAQARSRCHIALARTEHARCNADLDEIIDEVRRGHSDRQKWELVLNALP
jgi:hypothetical protein